MVQAESVIRYEDAAEQVTVTGWACKTCQRFWGDDEHMARYCCSTEGPCEDCGERRDRHNRLCKTCKQKKSKESLRKKIDDAEEVSREEYTGMVFVEELSDMGGPEGFCDSVSDAAEMIRDAFCDFELETQPEWAFACEPQHLKLDIYEVIENLCSDGYEDMKQNQTIPKSLINAVEQFNKINEKSLTVWRVDYSRKIRIPKAIDEAE